jgi:16S rRNA (cytosine1407-C5)-methyltransferase
LLTKISEDFLRHAEQTFLPPQQIDEFLTACQTPLRKSVRVNTLKTSVEHIVALLESYGFELVAIPWCKEGFWLHKKGSEGNLEDGKEELQLGNLAQHMQGLFYIQEASSMLPPQALLTDALTVDTPFDECLTLDMAASPGSKTTQIAAMQGNQGIILANELSSSRVKVLHANLVRCGVASGCMTQFDGRKLGQRLDGVFDFVLLDAPCGGEGTVRKDPKALENWNLQSVLTMAELQKQLIETAFRCVKPGGRLVYSTCTLSPEENQMVTQHLLQNTDATIHSLVDLFDGANRSATKEGYLHVLPHIYDSEGFFVAAFNKPMESKVEDYRDTAKRLEKAPFELVNKKTERQVIDYYQKHFGLVWTKEMGSLYQRDKTIWLFPKLFERLSPLVRFNRSGLKVAEIYPNKIRTAYEFFMAFGAQFEKQGIEVCLTEMEAFIKGKNLDHKHKKANIDSKVNDGEVVLLFQGCPVGSGTLQKKKIKNQLPRDLVKDQIVLA